ncbi:MAG: prolyl-tRNA synthetase associated domain-containing protein [Desulfosarcinaceae bacterium]|nr:prolyl-tRNA synthetase associated domain-containing protein [Desulfosarcinaceae bacterium]
MNTADALCRYLNQHAIPFQRCDHPAVYTCAEADARVPVMPGAKCKNLFLCGDKGRQHLLVVVPADKRVDLKALSHSVGIKNLRFGSPQRLERCLGITPGAVTLLALVNDEDCSVMAVIDEALWSAEALLCHPLVNTSTLCLPLAAVRRFLRATGHTPRIMAVPAK